MVPPNHSLDYYKDIHQKAHFHLSDLIQPDGRFVYKYDLDRGSLSNKYNILRHAGCVWALNTYRGDLPVGVRVKQAKRYLFDQAVTPPNGIGKCIPEGSGIKIGASALALLALISDEDRESFSSLAGDLVDYMMSQSRENGNFVHKVDLTTGEDMNFYSVYYTGEVIFALLEYGFAFDDKAVISFAQDSLLARLKEQYGIRQHSHWMMYAARSLFARSPSEQIIEYTIKFVEELARNNLYRTWGRGTPVACRNEALLSALDIARASGAMCDYLPIIECEIAENLQEQARYFLPHGGFVGNLAQRIVRIDFIQHHMPAFYARGVERVG